MGHCIKPTPARVLNRIPRWLFAFGFWITWWARRTFGRFLQAMRQIVRKRGEALSPVPPMVRKLIRLGTKVVHRTRANLRAGRDFWYAIDKAAGRC